MNAVPQDLARQLLAEGAILIVAGCPVGTEFGIDLASYHIDTKFRGVKMIPPGVHYVYTAAVDQQYAIGQSDSTAVATGVQNSSVMRSGFMRFFGAGEIVVRQWDDEREELKERAYKSPAEAETEADRIRANIPELDKYLASYDYTELPSWNLLTQEITAARLGRVLPVCGVIRTAAEYASCPDADRPRAHSNKTAHIRRLNNRMLQNDDALLPDLPLVPDTALRFTALPPRCPADATPAQVTAAFMDCRAAVERMLQAFGPSSTAALVDECECAFVFYMVGCSLDALQHWRRMLHLLANSERAVAEWPGLYAAYVRCLTEQLPHIPIEMHEAGDFNTVLRDVGQLVRNCRPAARTHPALAAALPILVGRIRETIGWQLNANGAETDDDDDDDPENAPVVVDMCE